MSESARSMPWVMENPTAPESLVTRERLVTHGLGGYAWGTVSGVAMRRYHGLLITAQPSPLGRMMMFNPEEVADLESLIALGQLDMPAPPAAEDDRRT